VLLHVTAGCELEYRIRLMQVRNEINLELTAIPERGAGGTGRGAGGRGQDDEDPFSDGGEGEPGPAIAAMEEEE